jgi:hypothetical protein
LVDRLAQVLHASDVQDRATGEVLCKTVGIYVEPNLDGVPPDKSHVVVGDVVMRPVGKMNSEGSEGFGLHKLPNLFRGNHRLTVAGTPPGFKANQLASYRDTP